MSGESASATGIAKGGLQAPAATLRLLVAAFGDAGHALPAIALARALRDRGHEVMVESWEQWRGAVEGEGLAFTPAQEYTVYPPPGPDTPDGETAAAAARALARLMDGFRPDLVVSDILTLAPTLAAEASGVPRATLVPHLYPVQERGQPFFSFGALPPRTPLGRLAWRAAWPLLATGLRRGRRELNETRARLGLPALDRFHGGISEELVLVATYPQLEYPRRWPSQTAITGPMLFEAPAADGAGAVGSGGAPVPKAGDGGPPLVVIAPSTSQDAQCELLRAALQGLSEEPVRVVATTNRHRPAERLEVPANATLEPWLSYSGAMPEADLVICHGGHGTVARALASGTPLLVCPAVGDMAENGARVAWAQCGLTLPRRLLSPARVRRAARAVLGAPRFRERAGELAAWARRNDGAARGAEAVERFATARRG